MNRRWEWIILSVRSLTVFEENIVVTVLAKLVPLFFKCSCAFSFLTRSLIDRCQIVTDSCKNNVSKSVWKAFKSPLSLSENVSERHLSLSCITSILTTTYSLKNCSVYGRSCRIYSPESFWFSQRISSSLKKRNVFSRPRSQFFTIRTSQPANNMYLWYYSSIHPSI